MTKLEGNELSEREVEILRLVATGASNKEIALKLFISPNTVKVHLRNIFGKIGAASRTEAAMYAVQSGLIPGVPEQENQAPSQILSPAVSDTHQKRRFPWWITALVIIVGITALSSFGIILRSSLQSTSSPPANLQENKPNWRVLQPLPTARTGMAATTFENSIFLIGGESTQGITGQVDIYNPELDAWERRADKPLPVTDAMAAVVGGRIIVPGGKTESEQVTDQVDIYDPLFDQWDQGASLPKPVSGYALAVYEGKIILLGGWDGTNYLANVYVYDLNMDVWVEKTPLPNPRAYAGAGTARGKIFLFGGFDGKSALDNVATYNPNLDNNMQQPWVSLNDMPQERYRMGITNTDSIIYLVGGKNESEESLPVIGYLIQTGEWIQVDAPLAQPWINPATTFLGTHMYVFGGSVNNTPLSISYSYQVLYITVFPLVP